MERLLYFQAVERSRISHYLPDGSRLDLINTQEPEIKPGDTAFHEAKHVAGADFQIIRASNIPQGNSLGHTIPREMTAAAAAAAEATGHSGTGHDMRIVDRLGVDRSSAISEARAKLSGKETETLEVAREIERRGTIFQSDVNQALERASRRRRGIFAVRGEIRSSDGNVQVFERDTYMGEVTVFQSEIQHEQAA